MRYCLSNGARASGKRAEVSLVLAPRRSQPVEESPAPLAGTGGAILMTTGHVPFVHRDPEEAIVLAAGLRTPQVRAGRAFAGEDAGHLGSALARELLVRHGLDGSELDEVLFGCAIPPHETSNVARAIALRAGLPARVPARTVGRGGGSGMEAVTAAITSIRAGLASACLCGGVETMSAYPLLMGPELTDLFGRLSRTRSIGGVLEAWSAFRPGWLKPRSVGLESEIDPLTGTSRGAAAEALAEEFGVSREAADTFALRSHRRAARARDAGHFEEEILPWLPLGARDGSRALQHDEGIRDGLTRDSLAELSPRFVEPDGTVTAGNSAGSGDGATALLVATEARAVELCLEPLARVRALAWVGVEPARSGLAPVFAAARVLESAGIELADLEGVELDEAFAARVLACAEAFASDIFGREELGRRGALGELDPERLNPGGGAIALGRPVGAEGARLLLTTALRLRREGGGLRLVTLGSGDGLGGAMILERGNG